MFVVVTLTGVAIWSCIEGVREWNRRSDNEYVFVAGIDGKPDDLFDRINQELIAAGIKDGGCEGSITYGISVRRKDAFVARRILRDFGKRNPKARVTIY
jgi:hypothetical protein